MASYDKADLDAAVVEARARRATGQGSVVDVARQYEIPPTTLYGHVANPDMGTGQGGGTALSAEAESALLDWISAQSNTSTAEIRRKAAELEKLEAEQAGRAEHWPDGMATDGWWRSFKLRNNVDHHSTFTVGCA